MNPRRLYRSRDRQLAGVAGGMAEYLDIDPTVVRILWVIVGIASAGFALVAYVILALVMPQAPYASAPIGGWGPAPTATSPAAGPAAGWGTPPTPPAGAPAWGQGWDAGAAAYAQPTYRQPTYRQPAESRGIGAAAIVGVVLIVFGAIALADTALPGWVAGAILGPAVILALGAALLASSLRRRPDEAPQAPAPAPATDRAPAPASSTDGLVFPAGPWDTTDTQAVGPTGFAPASGTPDETTGQGSAPA